jgi:hypothetical protein
MSPVVTNVPRMLTLKATELCVSVTSVISVTSTVHRMFQICFKLISEWKGVLYSIKCQVFVCLYRILQVT